MGYKIKSQTLVGQVNTVAFFIKQIYLYVLHLTMYQSSVLPINDIEQCQDKMFCVAYLLEYLERLQKNVYSNTVCVSGACVNVLIKTYKPTSKIETNNSLRTSVKWSEIHHSHVLESFNVKNKVINWLEDHFEFH